MPILVNHKLLHLLISGSFTVVVTPAHFSTVLGETQLMAVGSKTADAPQ